MKLFDINVVTLVLGALIGALFSYYMPIVITRVKRRILDKTIENRLRVIKSGAIWNWLIGFHREFGGYDELYNCKFNNYETKIPFLTLPEWQYIVEITPNHNEFIEFSKGEKQDFAIDNDLINQRLELGQKLFMNEPAIYADRVEVIKGKILLHVRACGFEEVATRMIGFEDEAFNGVLKNTYKLAKRRKERLLYIKALLNDNNSPLPIGCAASFFIKREHGGYEVLLHERSEKTLTWGGAKAVLPNYGLMPIPAHVNSDEVSVLYNNFLREYLEELFNYEQLIRPTLLKKTDVKWFYEMPETKLLSDSSEFGLYFTGMGINTLNGVLNLSMLALVNDVGVGETIRKKIRGNWEIKVPDGSDPTIEFLSIDSSAMEDLLVRKAFNPASAFSIARGIEALSELKLIHK